MVLPRHCPSWEGDDDPPSSLHPCTYKRPPRFGCKQLPLHHRDSDRSVGGSRCAVSALVTLLVCPCVVGLTTTEDFKDTHPSPRCRQTTHMLRMYGPKDGICLQGVGAPTTNT